MSEPDFRPRLSGDLKEAVERAAKLRGISASELIEAAIRADLKTADSRAQRIAGLKADNQLDRIERLYVELDHFKGQFNTLISKIAESIPKTLKAEVDSLKSTIERTGGTSHLRDLLKELNGASEKRQNERFDKLEKLIEKAGDNTALHQQIRKIDANFVQQHRAIAAGAGGMLLVLLALSFPLADTAPSRWVATRLMGESDRLDAGVKLASSNQVVKNSIFRTSMLSSADRKFGQNLEVCLDRFMIARSYVTCTIAFNPPQIEARGNAR